MTAAPIAIAGKVVDDRGAAVPRAVVRTSSGARMITDEKGRFSLRGTPEQRPTRIGVQVSGYLRHSQTVAFGDQQAKVVLTRAARFTGSFPQ